MLGKESPSATEIELIKSRSIIGEAVDKLKLDIVIAPNYFPLVGEFIARRFKSTAPDDVSSPWLGMNSFAWGESPLNYFSSSYPRIYSAKN